ncbi:MAG: ATP-binding protein, partial [Planctomyces sp.]
MTDFEKLGQFYLGRVHDLTSDKTAPDQPILYDARDLTTHAVCVGMTGSGKTGLCLALIEEAAIYGIPAICIDPKGDLGNLMLTFPELRSQDFEPWVDSDEATRQGLSSEELAEKTATLWRNGLKQWGQDGDRIRKMRETTDVTIYTPASTAGRQLTVLKSFAAPDEQTEPGSEAFREKILGTVSGLLALMQIDDDPVSSREHILLSTILDHFWRAGTDVDMAMLIRSIQSPPFRKVGFLDVDSFYPSGDRFKLAMSLNNLLASPSFAAWLEGEPLSIPNLLYSPEGKPQIAVISVAHLSDAERMFFVTILLNEVLSWVRSQTGTTSLRAILYMDEVFGYFPPTANPPSKQPMLTLLKQARAFGLGVVLATQNPVDLDYKGLSNCGTWFLGRLQTERDKKRVIEGLEGVAASTGGKFDRGEMEQTLAGLGRRVFLMNNVHEDGPVVFESRWALSFLRGPLSRQQIQTLMESQTGTARSAAVASAGRSMSAKPSDTRGTGAATRSTAASVRSAAASAQAVSAPSDTTDHSQSQHRPVLPPRIVEVFFPASLSAERILYRPAILGQAQVRYVDSSLNIDQWDEVSLLRLAVDEVPDNLWEDADEWDEAEIPELLTEPQADDAIYQELPVRITDPKAYPSWEKSL